MKLCMKLQKRQSVCGSTDMQFATYKSVASLTSHINRRVDSTAGIEVIEQVTLRWLRNAHSKQESRLADLRIYPQDLLGAVRVGYIGKYTMRERPYVITREFLRSVQEKHNP